MPEIWCDSKTGWPVTETEKKVVGLDKIKRTLQLSNIKERRGYLD